MYIIRYWPCECRLGGRGGGREGGREGGNQLEAKTRGKERKAFPLTLH